VLTEISKILEIFYAVISITDQTGQILERMMIKRVA